MEIALGFGKEKIPVQVPDNQVMAVLTPNEAEIGLTGSDDVYRSMREPIGLPPLRAFPRLWRRAGPGLGWLRQTVPG